MPDEDNERTILAGHGRWISKLRDAIRLYDQRLAMFERRVSALEGNLAELTKTCCRLDVQMTSMGDELARLGSRLDVLAKNLTPSSKHRRLDRR